MSGRLLAATALLAGLVLAGPARGAELSLEIRCGYHMPRSDEFRDVYKGGLAFGAQLETRLTENLDLWAGADYFGKTGRITFTGEETKIRIIPLAAGLKVHLASASLRPYLAAGAGYVLYREASVLGTSNGGVFGFLGQAGLTVRVAKSLALDLYARYSAAKTKAAEPDVLAGELGGFQGGLGLVIAF